MNQTEILKKVRTFIFGERAKGEFAYKKQTFRTTYPENKISEFDWYREFRVSSLHGIKQNVHLNY
jgi:hypothetical protein